MKPANKETCLDGKAMEGNGYHVDILSPGGKKKWKRLHLLNLRLDLLEGKWCEALFPSIEDPATGM